MKFWHLPAVALTILGCSDDAGGRSVQCFDKFDCALDEICDPVTYTCIPDPGQTPDGEDVLKGTFDCRMGSMQPGTADVAGRFADVPITYSEVLCEPSNLGLQDMVRVSFSTTVPLEGRSSAVEGRKFELYFNAIDVRDGAALTTQYPYEHPLPSGRFFGVMNSQLLDANTETASGPVLPNAYTNIGRTTLDGSPARDETLSGSLEVWFEQHGKAVLGAPCNNILDCASPTGLDCVRIDEADSMGMCLWGVCLDDPRCQAQFTNSVCVQLQTNGVCVPTCVDSAGCFDAQNCVEGICLAGGAR